MPPALREWVERRDEPTAGPSASELPLAAEPPGLLTKFMSRELVARDWVCTGCADAVGFGFVRGMCNGCKGGYLAEATERLEKAAEKSDEEPLLRAPREPLESVA